MGKTKEKLIQKYGIGTVKETESLRRLLLQVKKFEEDETLFTITKYGIIPKEKAKDRYKCDHEINVYDVELADDISGTEYYFLDIESLSDFDENKSDENTFCILLLGEITYKEAPSLCGKKN